VGKADIGTADCARAGFAADIGSYAEETLWLDIDKIDPAITGIAIAGITVCGGISLKPEL